MAGKELTRCYSWNLCGYLTVFDGENHFQLEWFDEVREIPMGDLDFTDPDCGSDNMLD